jgi:hypothetical protein
MLSKDHYERALSYKRRSDKAIEKGREPPEPSEKYLEDMEKTPSPYITGQYGLASDIYKTAAAKLGMDADDLQALMWFLEKEKWERAGWTPIDKNPSLIDLMKRDNPPEKADDIRKFAIERGLTK